MNTTGEIYGINGPIVSVVCDKQDFRMGEMVKVGNEQLLGEVIKITHELTIVQVFENTTGLRPNEPVIGSGKPLSVKLGPGIIGNIFDGVERPLLEIQKSSGIFISRGIAVESLDVTKEWNVKIKVTVGAYVTGGTVIATVAETPSVTHYIMVPPDLCGTVTKVVNSGSYTIQECIVKISDDFGREIDITLVTQWPIRIPRPCAKRESISKPLVTGQRVIDTLFPIAKGGTAAVPGGFGTGKTMTQHQLAKWSDADIVVYIGCGERGNEMTQVLEDFSKLMDPRTNQSLLDRTVLIANTSNMPVAAREASIYTGITIAEYYRDMGYHVAIMADSTSRWAEALRELSGRLEEMPAEEGFPAYLSSRLAHFYERACYVTNLNKTEGSVTVIGAVSPQGGDFSEPVTQNTKRFVRCFWTLDRALAYARHFPAIAWLTSYSEYVDDLDNWYRHNVGEEFPNFRNEILKLLNEESKLMEIVRLIGSDVLPENQKLILEISRVIRLGFVQQNAYHMHDTYVPLIKQMKMMAIILYLHTVAKKLIDMGMPMSLLKKDSIFERIISIKYEVGNDELYKFDDYKKEIDEFYLKMYEKNA